MKAQALSPSPCGVLLCSAWQKFYWGDRESLSMVWPLGQDAFVRDMIRGLEVARYRTSSCMWGQCRDTSIPWWMWHYVKSMEPKPNLLILDLPHACFQVCAKNTQTGNTIGTHYIWAALPNGTILSFVAVYLLQLLSVTLTEVCKSLSKTVIYT